MKTLKCRVRISRGFNAGTVKCGRILETHIRNSDFSRTQDLVFRETLFHFEIYEHTSDKMPSCREKLIISTAVYAVYAVFIRIDQPKCKSAALRDMTQHPPESHGQRNHRAWAKLKMWPCGLQNGSLMPQPWLVVRPALDRSTENISQNYTGLSNNGSCAPVKLFGNGNQLGCSVPTQSAPAAISCETLARDLRSRLTDNEKPGSCCCPCHTL